MLILAAIFDTLGAMLPFAFLASMVGVLAFIIGYIFGYEEGRKSLKGGHK